MVRVIRASRFAITALLAAAAVGCGSSGHSSSSSTSGAAAGAGGAGALSAEAKSAATGDIPDTQSYLVFHNQQAGYSIKYPEGWTEKGTGADVSFSDKNNIVHVLVASGGAPSTAGLSAELTKLKSSTPTLSFQPPTAIHLTAGPAVKASYTTESAPNSVTGKSVQLIVDRYEFARGGKRVTVDLGTAKGVDNIDAYRMMINSFGWR
jgi:hypothetical protein